MPLPKFEYCEPKTIEEACHIMVSLGNKSALLAGGTDILVKMKNRLVAPEYLVSLGGLADLAQIHWFEDRVEIGACCTVSQLISEEFKREFGALHEGASCLGSPLIRNLATIGGNIASARPAADMLPSLMVYDSRVVLQNSKGERFVALHEFFTDVGKTVMEQGEILTRVVIPRPICTWLRHEHKTRRCCGGAYIKLGIRKSLEISLVNVAAFIALDEKDNTIETARIVMGAVGPTPLRAISAEEVLMGEKPGIDLFARAAQAASQESRPIDNFRGSASYRRAMVEVLTQRSLERALQHARNSTGYLTEA